MDWRHYRLGADDSKVGFRDSVARPGAFFSGNVELEGSENMNLTIQIPDERAALYLEQAQARGLTVERWLLELADQNAHSCSIAHLQKTDPKEWARQFRAWADSHRPDTPVLSDEAMSRESIYPDRA